MLVFTDTTRCSRLASIMTSSPPHHRLSRQQRQQRPDLLQSLYVTITNMLLMRTSSSAHALQAPPSSLAQSEGEGDERAKEGEVAGGQTIPRTTAGRILMSGLWLFSMALVACYTANLAAILITGELKAGRVSFESLDQRKGNKLRLIYQLFVILLLPFSYTWSYS